MAGDNNRGRDLPRAPKFQRLKGLPKPDEPGYSAALARRKELVSKKLERETVSHGFNSLFGDATSRTEKSRQQVRALIIEALALGLTVHSGMLARHGLRDQPNPKTPPMDPNEPPF